MQAKYRLFNEPVDHLYASPIVTLILGHSILTIVVSPDAGGVEGRELMPSIER